MRCIKLMKSVNLIFHENACCWAFFMCAIMFASKIWFRMAHKIFCLKILVGPLPVALMHYVPDTPDSVQTSWCMVDTSIHHSISNWTGIPSGWVDLVRPEDTRNTVRKRTSCTEQSETLCRKRDGTQHWIFSTRTIITTKTFKDRTLKKEIGFSP